MRQGEMWIGTDGGLSRWQGGKFTNFTTREGLSHNAVDALYQDREQTLWIGTRGGGLNRFKGRQIHRLYHQGGIIQR